MVCLCCKRKSEQEKPKKNRHPPTHRLSVIVVVTTILRPLCSCRRSLSGRFLLPLPGDFTTQLLLDLVAQDGRCLHTRHTHTRVKITTGTQ